MDFDLTDEQRMLQDGARRFIREQYGFDARRVAVNEKLGFSAAHWSTFAELGWLALSLPESCGGFGCSFTEVALLLEEFGKGLVVEPFLSTAVVGGRILERAATPGALAVLERVAAGEARLALAHDEPEEHHQRHRTSMTATRTQAGYELSGAKIMVLDAPSATHLIVSARLESDPGFALFMVEADAAASLRHDYRLIDDSRAADFALTGLAVPPDALLLRGEAARDVLDDALDRATLGQVAFGLGAMEAVLGLTNDYIKSRAQFGQPLGKFQALQHRMAEMFTQAQSVRSMLFHGLAAIDAAPAVRAAAVSSAKVVAAEAGFFVGSQGIQLHGGIGMTEDYAVGHYFKRFVALEKAYGDAGWHLRRFTSLAVA